MPTPTRAELRDALQAIQRAADALKAYEAGPVKSLQAEIRAHIGTIREAEDLPAEALARRTRVVSQCSSTADSIARAIKYPEVPMARATVVEIVPSLSRAVRELLAALGPPAQGGSS